MKTKKIFSLELANKLARRGHKIVDTEINLSNPKLKVFLFKYSDELMKDMTEITRNK